MFWYSKLGVNILSLLIAFILFGLSFCYEINVENNIGKVGNPISIFKQREKNKPIKIFLAGEEGNFQFEKLSSVNKENLVEENTIVVAEEKEIESYEWEIEIPSIKLLAPIQEGTTSKIMNQAIGHFEETGSINGNIGLAAHNRGYEKNYFENLKNLKIGDKIFYRRLKEEKVYVVTQTLIIKEDDWTYLQSTEDNRLTLITCVENQPEYRRCVQAKEIKEEGEINEK